MGKADEYLRRAREADRQAGLAISNSARADFKRIASNWRDLARQADLLDDAECAAGYLSNESRQG
jgi:hypothetical protein